MRKINITRKKHFAGCLIKYLCILNMSKNSFEKYVASEFEDKELLSEQSQIIPIANGKTITFTMDNNKCELFIVAFTSTGEAHSNIVIIDEGYIDKSYLLKTKYSFTKGSKYELIET